MPLSQTSLGVAGQYTANLSIEYFEKPPYTEVWNLDGGEVKRTLLTNWSDARLFHRAMLGDVRRSADHRFLDREIHERFPDSSKPLWAVDCVLRNGHGAATTDPDNRLIKFTDQVNNLDGMAEWEVTYRSLQYDVLSDQKSRQGAIAKEVAINGERTRYVSKTFKFNTEVFQLPGVLFSWPDGTPIPEGMGKQRHWVEMRYTWHWVPEPLPAVIFALEEAAVGVPLGGAGPPAPPAPPNQRSQLVLGAAVLGLGFLPGGNPLALGGAGGGAGGGSLIAGGAAAGATGGPGPPPNTIPGLDGVPQAFEEDDAPPEQLIPDPIQGRAIRLPAGSVRVTIGKVNLDEFDGFSPGHLLCSVAEISERKWTPAGTPVRNITYVFFARPDAPWNSFYRRTTGRFESVQVRDEANRERLRNAGLPYQPYGTARFNQLFWP